MTYNDVKKSKGQEALKQPLSITDVNARFHRCPMPVLLAHRALRQCPPNHAIRLIATDPASDKDVPHFCKTHNFQLLNTQIKQQDHIFIIMV